MGEGRADGGGVGVPPLRDLTEDREAAASAAAAQIDWESRCVSSASKKQLL